jgi:hypothetical protein
VSFAGLAPLIDAALVLQEVAAALGVREEAERLLLGPVLREISRRDNAIEKVVVSDSLSPQQTKPWHGPTGAFFGQVRLAVSHARPVGADMAVGQSHPSSRALALDWGRGVHSGDLASSLGSTRRVPGPPRAGFPHCRGTRRLARRLRRATDNRQRPPQRRQLFEARACRTPRIRLPGCAAR